MHKPAEFATAFAPAKINLTLRVTGRRSDGYHLLDSVVAFADVGDRITVRQRHAINAGTSRFSGPFGADLSDEAERAQLLSTDSAIARLAHRLGQDRDELVTFIEKNLPLASGIGGGTSDAAAAIRAAHAVWGGDLSRAVQDELARSLGADGPCCTAGVPLRMTGIGDKIQVLAHWPRLPVVLANPGKRVSTPDVFRAFADSGASFASSESPPPSASNVDEAIQHLAGSANDLMEPAIQLVPEISEIVARLIDMPDALLARMSGSGATVFCVYRTHGAAQHAELLMNQHKPQWWVRAATLGGHEDMHGITCKVN